jgi:hypothetical protein
MNSDLVYLIKQLFHSLSSNMSDSRFGARHLISYQLIFDQSSYIEYIIVKYIHTDI